jgi:ribosomal protein L11 methyltransferase
MFELVLRVPQALVETVGEMLADALDAQAVSVEDADAGTDAEQAVFGEPGQAAAPIGWNRSTLRALFDDASAAEAAAACLLAQPGLDGIVLRALQPVPEQDWVRLTQSQFDPVPITERFWIVPSWHAPPAAATTWIRLDPGLAFGTGTHPTTRMCLRWIAGSGAVMGAQVLDYGCGSGILAIAAARHGAREVTAVDIDPAAIGACADNARANSVALRIGTPEQAIGEYDVVLANILAAPLKVLAPLLSRRVAPGGHLVLAGLLDRQADELAQAYAPWLSIVPSDREDGWTMMVAQRPPHRP